MNEVSAEEKRHFMALTLPADNEIGLVLALQGLVLLADTYSGDHVLREGVVQVALGLRRLLIGNHGDRLIMGKVDTFLATVMEQCHFDPDLEVFRDG